MPPRTSDDVRRIVVNMHTMGCSHLYIAAVVKVTDRTVRSIVAEWVTTGSVQSQLSFRGALGRPRALDFNAAWYLRERIAQSPSMYMDEIQRDLGENLNIHVHPSTIYRTMKRYSITRKKLTRSAAERSEETRDEFRIVTTGIPPEYFVFVDESSIDGRTPNRDMGYSLKGERAPQETHFVRGDRYSILPALSLDGIVALDAVKGSYTAQTFRAFIEQLLMEMNPYPGKNSIIVMDNCRIHKDLETLRMITDRGMHYLFLPPYSPDFNPIELAFSKIKKGFRRDGGLARMQLTARGLDAEADLLGLIYRHVYSVTREDARGWYRHCHYI